MAGNNVPSCRVCDETDPADLVELDQLLLDPSRWPRNIFGKVTIPSGPLPPAYRVWGGVALGKAWLAERGIVVKDSVMRRHFTAHIPAVGMSLYETATLGAAAVAPPTAKPAEVVAVTPINFLDYYAKGLELGHKGLELMQQRVERMLKADPESVPIDMMYKMADIGMRLATSEAALVARGAKMRRDAEEEDEGFRAGSMPPPSPRMGHSRVRVIEGEARPIRDHGPADRRSYNETATQEGSPTLPAP